MSDPSPQPPGVLRGHDVTRVLHAAAQGDPHAAASLLPLVYDELRALARARLARTPPGNTLQPTALVHEAYMRLVGKEPDAGDAQVWAGRAHFFGAAAKAMRDILVEQARRKGAIKHGGNRARLSASHAEAAEAQLEAPVEDLLALDAALKKLEVEDPRKAELVALRFFAGLSSEQAAAVLGVTTRTAERDWRFAKVWLHREMEGAADAPDPPEPA